MNPFEAAWQVLKMNRVDSFSRHGQMHESPNMHPAAMVYQDLATRLFNARGRNPAWHTNFDSEEIADDIEGMQAGEQPYYAFRFRDDEGPHFTGPDPSADEVLRRAREQAREMTRSDLAESTKNSRSVGEIYDATSQKQPHNYSSLEGYTPRGKPVGVEMRQDILSQV